MTAAVMAAVTAANLKIQEDEQQETGGWDSPETVEESLDITPELVRMASSGHRGSIEHIKVAHKIRELKFKVPNPGRVQNMSNLNLAGKLGMTQIETNACHVAFLAYDVDGSGYLDADEARQAFAGAMVQIPSADGEYDLERFLAVCKEKRSSSIQLRQRISTFYLSTPVQQSVGFLIILNFIFNLIGAQFPTLTEGTWYSIDAGFEYFFTFIFVVELGFNMVSFWFKLFWASSWNIFDFVIVLASLLILHPSAGDAPGLSTLGLLKPLRIFRLFKRVPALKRLMEALGASIPGVMNAFLVLLIVMLIFSILAVEFFRESANQQCALTFKRLDIALFNMFVVATGDGWAENVAIPCAQGESEENIRLSPLFFTVYELITSFVLINVVVGFLLEKMVIDNYNELPQILKREQEHVSSEVFKVKTKQEKERRFQNMIQTELKRALRDEPRTVNGYTQALHDEPRVLHDDPWALHVKSVHGTTESSSFQPGQMSDSAITALPTDELTAFIKTATQEIQKASTELTRRLLEAKSSNTELSRCLSEAQVSSPRTLQYDMLHMLSARARSKDDVGAQDHPQGYTLQSAAVKSVLGSRAPVPSFGSTALGFSAAPSSRERNANGSNVPARAQARAAVEHGLAIYA